MVLCKPCKTLYRVYGTMSKRILIVSVAGNRRSDQKHPDIFGTVDPTDLAGSGLPHDPGDNENFKLQIRSHRGYLWNMLQFYFVRGE